MVQQDFPIEEERTRYQRRHQNVNVDIQDATETSPSTILHIKRLERYNAFHIHVNSKSTKMLVQVTAQADSDPSTIQWAPAFVDDSGSPETYTFDDTHRFGILVGAWRQARVLVWPSTASDTVVASIYANVRTG